MAKLSTLLVATCAAVIVCLAVVEGTCKKDSYAKKPGDECFADYTDVASTCWQKCSDLKNFTQSKFKDNLNDCARFCTVDSAQCAKVTTATAVTLGVLSLTGTYDDCPTNRTK